MGRGIGSCRPRAALGRAGLRPLWDRARPSIERHAHARTAKDSSGPWVRGRTPSRFRPPRPVRVAEQAESVAPMPEGTRLVAQEEGAGEGDVAEAEQGIHHRVEQDRAEAVAGQHRRDEDPGQVRQGAAGGRDVEPLGVIAGLEGDQGGGDRGVVLERGQDHARAGNIGAVAAVAGLVEALAGGVEAAFVAQSGERGDPPEGVGERLGEGIPVGVPHRADGEFLRAPGGDRRGGRTRSHRQESRIGLRPGGEDGAVLEILVFVGGIDRQGVELLDRDRQLDDLEPVVDHGGLDVRAKGRGPGRHIRPVRKSYQLVATITTRRGDEAGPPALARRD